jgi:hypothetical protein
VSAPQLERTPTLFDHLHLEPHEKVNHKTFQHGKCALMLSCTPRNESWGAFSVLKKHAREHRWNAFLRLV